MPAHKLILLPLDPRARVSDCADLATALHDIGLVDTPMHCSEGRFFPVGESFLDLVSFLGCSPLIELSPPDDPAMLDQAVTEGRFCHLFLECARTPRLRADPQARPPRCPHCRRGIGGWRQLVESWQEDAAAATWNCRECGKASRPLDWIFRKTAAIGSTFVEIRGIHPSEAVPGTALLQALQGLTGGPWHAIYIKE